MKRLLFLPVLVLALASCKKKSNPDPEPAPPLTPSLYFPPVGSNNWELSTQQAQWNQDSLNALAPWLQSKNTKAFIILHNGKIAYEKYFGTFTADSLWYWASAGKTATALLAGIAVQERWLDINKKVSHYLGTGWTSAPPAKEDLITVRHLLTMTSGLDEGVPDDDCTTPACLQYKADAGTRWAYHNGAHTKLHDVIAIGTGEFFNNYFASRVRDRIGMNGGWFMSGAYNEIYASTARSAARFGLLMQNKANWNGTQLVSEAWWNAQTNSSQAINNSYGYLTWLNGKASFMAPQTQLVFPGSMFPDAPADLFSALGKNDQKIYVSRGQNLVVVRFGNAAGGSTLAASSFDRELWTKLRGMIRSW